MESFFIPTITANIDGHDQPLSLVSYDFSAKRMVYINGEISEHVALSASSQLRYLDAKSDDDIILVINSPGGSVPDGMVIYDAMKYETRCDIVTVATGMAASMGAFLLAAGTKGKRYATPSTELMIHQPLGGVQGQATDISLVADHIQSIKRKLAEIMAAECGKTVDELMRDTERDNWKTSKQALEYGLIDHIGFPNMEDG